MKVFTDVNDAEIARLLTSGGVGILRTDTLYGLVARADSEAAVERVYQLKARDVTKSPIVLISSFDHLFDAPPPSYLPTLHQVWPGKVSVILPASHAPRWLQRENNSIAYRLPANESLVALLGETGPLIAPSANPEGSPPARSFDEAVKYFGESIDFYVDQGTVTDETPSRLIRLLPDGNTEQLR